MADDVATFASALGVAHPLILGFSDGGQIALELGMRYPSFARVLAMVGAFYKFSERYFEFVRAMGMEGPNNVNFEQTQQDHPDVIAYWQAEHARSDDPAYWQKLIKQLSVLWYTPVDYTPEDFELITAPTLIMLGDRDGAIPVAQAVEMYQMIPKAELAIVPNADHGGPLTHVGTLPTVLDFFKRHST
jgi:pimeloyl-ACP methyl ester carboxylesterase